MYTGSAEVVNLAAFYIITYEEKNDLICKIKLVFLMAFSF